MFCRQIVLGFKIRVKIIGVFVPWKDSKDTSSSIINKYNSEIIWASTREVLNIFECAEYGCDIITVSPDLISKLANLEKNLEDFSVNTVQMFYKDAKQAGYKI